MTQLGFYSQPSTEPAFSTWFLWLLKWTFLHQQQNFPLEPELPITLNLLSLAPWLCIYSLFFRVLDVAGCKTKCLLLFTSALCWWKNTQKRRRGEKGAPCIKGSEIPYGKTLQKWINVILKAYWIKREWSPSHMVFKHYMGWCNIWAQREKRSVSFQCYGFIYIKLLLSFPPATLWKRLRERTKR